MKANSTHLFLVRALVFLLLLLYSLLVFGSENNIFQRSPVKKVMLSSSKTAISKEEGYFVIVERKH